MLFITLFMTFLIINLKLFIMNRYLNMLLKIMLSPVYFIFVYIPELIDDAIFKQCKNKIKINRKHCIYLVNPLSGKCLGKKLLSILNEKDTSAIALNIMKADYITVIKKVISESDEEVFIVVCGGDGTFSILVKEIKLKIKELDKLVFVPMPIGTGNDLSRSLNLGAKLSMNYIYKFFEKLDSKKSEVISIDTWHFSMRPSIDNKRANTLKIEKQLLLYMGIGYDAHIIYDFERLREKMPFLFVVNVK